MMKKALLLFTAFGLILFLSGCGGKEVGEAGIIKGESFQTEGWLDDNTFQVSALGTWEDPNNPDLKTANDVIKRNRSKEGAVLKAQTAVMEKFKGYALKAKGGAESGVGLGEVAEKNIEGYAKGGAIYKTTYDKDLNCEVLYRVEAKGLKKMADASFK